jgi:hypothetical protein
MVAAWLRGFDPVAVEAPGTWAAYIGSPGMIVDGLTKRLIGSESAFYVGVFLGNWLFYFCIIKAIVALRNRLR